MKREFIHYYPHADLTKFDISEKYGVSFNYKGMGYDVFKDTPSGPQEKYLDLELEQAMIKALGSRIPDPKRIAAEKKAASILRNAFMSTQKIVDDSNFPPQFRVNSKAVYPHHIPFSASPPDVGSFTDLKFYVDEGKYFKETLPDPFVNVLLTKRVDAAYSEWVTGPNFKFWPQMLNFVVWCSTAGCGIGLDMLTDDRVGWFLRFHVAFTIRRLLLELKAPFITAADDPDNITCDRSVLGVFKKQFHAPDDFRYTYGRNKGYGDLWTDYMYNPRSKHQWKYFIPTKSKDLTLMGLSRLNSSIEAFVYCVLGAQVITRKPVIGATGFAIETQQEFLNKFKDAIIENDIEKGIARYQLSIDLSKARLDYAIALGCWLMPSNMVINTQTIPGYNNKLQTATENMKFGVNNINNSRFLGILSFVASSKKHLGSLKLADEFKIKSLKDYFGEEEKTILPKTMLTETKTMLSETTTPNQDDHTLQKIGLSAAAIALGYYIVR